MSLPNPSRPGAMSLLDKYAQINANIEEARRRVTATRAELEATNQSIENLRDDRAAMEQETATAQEETTHLEEELKRVKVDWNEKVEEKERMELKHRLAKRECNDTRRQMDRERLAFLERCREFRSSCKRMRVAATILVLDGGGGGLDNVKGGLGEADVWRRLQEEDLDSSDDENGDAENRGSKTVQKRKNGKSDPELDEAVKDEKECREAMIEAECALHAARSEHEDAVRRCNARNQKLTQQRAQLERHRREVEELEREINQVKDSIVKANQDATSYENAWKRGQTTSNNSYNRNTSNNGSYSSHINPPPEYNNSNNRMPLHNSSSSSTYGGGGGSNGSVSNPYKSKPSNPYQSRPSGNRGVNNSRTSSHQYASEMLRNTTSNHNYASSGPPTQNRTWSSARNQRQFGTAVDISVDYSVNQRDASATPKYSSSSNCVSLNTPLAAAGDDSSVSSSSSGDDIISFDIFGGKGK